MNGSVLTFVHFFLRFWLFLVHRTNMLQHTVDDETLPTQLT